jgi:hypothetical protein
MAVPMESVKKVCTAAEVALVKLSRRPAVGKLSAVEARRLAARARKGFDKWQGQERSQARSRSREAGLGEAAERTALKTQIFREALDSFEEQASKGDGRAAPAKQSPKASRTAGHRKARAAVRDELAERKHAKNRRELPRSSSRPPESEATGDEEQATDRQESPAEHKKTAKPTSTVQRRRKALLTGAVDSPASNKSHLRQSSQARARAVATENRLLESGVKTRIRGHVSAQTQRSQAKRDAKPK